MRRYRRRANHKAKLIFKRFLFIVLSAVLIGGLAILTGNLLKNKVQDANEHLESIQPIIGDAIGGDDDLSNSETMEELRPALEVFASGISLSNHSTTDSLVQRIHTIAETYDTVSVILTNEDGIVYTSPALLNVLRIPWAEPDSSYESLISLCTAAKEKNLRISGILSSSLPGMDAKAASLIDATLAAELYSLGFHEILFTNIISDETDTDSIAIVKQYLETIRESVQSELVIGTVLPLAMHKDITFTKQIQTIASTVDFLAVDLSDVTVANDNSELTLEKTCLALQGAFQVYNTRILLATSDMTQLAEQYRLLASMELTNIQFLDEITPEILSVSVQPSESPTNDTVSETDSEGFTPQRNPYATSGSNSSGNNTGKDSEETYYQSGESGSSWY